MGDGVLVGLGVCVVVGVKVAVGVGGTVGVKVMVGVGVAVGLFCASSALSVLTDSVGNTRSYCQEPACLGITTTIYLAFGCKPSMT